ncbi:thiol-specific monooxygenase, partial [Bombardia bombarda]
PSFETIDFFHQPLLTTICRVYTPHLPAAIPSLRDLVEGRADPAISIPSTFPVETAKSEAINSHQLRFSDTAQHEHLHSNINPDIMAYTREPFPTSLSARILERYGPSAPFRHREVVREWVENIFVHNGHDKLLELSTTVERADKKDGEWVLTLRKENPGGDYWWQERFDALVVAAGHYSVPWLPNIPGLLEYDAHFPGRVVHSKHYRKGEKYKGKRVIVVGGSVSSHEIIHEILPYAQHPVYASLRGGPIPSFGWAPFLHPHISIKKQIVKMEAATGMILFSDGSTVDGVDHIIFGTGYSFSLPFLPLVQERIKTAYRRLPGVYQHTFDILDPTLTFVGMLGGGFTFKVYEWQAVAVARHLAGRAKTLPTIAEQRAWESKRVAERGGGKNYYSIAPDYEAFFEFLRELAGEPATGTSGRSLPKFNPEWKEIWADMAAPKIKWFQNERIRAEKEDLEIAGRFKSKL